MESTVVRDQHCLPGDAVVLAVGLELCVQLRGEVAWNVTRRSGQCDGQGTEQYGSKRAVHRDVPSAAMAHLGHGGG
jgi:hypothetical protein